MGVDGHVVEVDVAHEPELFWALRGGKCSVGIVTEIEFALMQVQDYYGGGIFFPGVSARAVLHAFPSWAMTLPDQATTSIALMRLPDMNGVLEPLRGKFVVHLRFMYLGDDEQGGALSRQAELPNAVGGREAAFSVKLIALLPSALQVVVPAVGAGVLRALEPWSTGGTQINFQRNLTAPEQVRRAWPEATWARPAELKRARDPQGRFTFGYPV